MKLAVGFDWADAVAIYRLRHGAPLAHPSMVYLPTGYFALDVGFLADGTIGVGMERFGPKPEPEIDLVHPDGHSTQARVPDGFGVVRRRQRVPRRRLSPGVRHRNGSDTRPYRQPSSSRAGSRWVVNGAAPGGPDRMTLVPGGLIAEGLNNGLVEVASQTRTRLFALPRQRYRNLPDSLWRMPPSGAESSTTTTTTLVPPPKWIWERDGVQQVVSDAAR